MGELLWNKLKKLLKEPTKEFNKMKLLITIISIVFLFFLQSCGKKSSLEDYPDRNRNYQTKK